MADPANPSASGPLPFDDDPTQSGVRGLGPFHFDGTPFTADSFTRYMATANLGTVPADFIILHHTAWPCTRLTYTDAARVFGNGVVAWDAGEDNLSDSQIQAKRLGQLKGIRDHYSSLGWDAGPHLFIDDKYIWLFTPLEYDGIHAMWGNGFHDAKGTYHNSIGIEVVGYYEHQPWPPAVEALVAHAVAALIQHLPAIKLEYLYPDPAQKPGRKDSGKRDSQGQVIWTCAHPELLRWGGISSHRDYNKPECPGAAITEDYYIGALAKGQAALHAG